MKSLVYTLLLASTPSLVFASSNQHLRGSDSGYTSEASAAHGYVESIDGAYGFNGISIPGENCDSTGLPMLTRKLTAWTSLQARAAYYFHHPAAQVKSYMTLNVKTGGKVSFILSITDPDAPTDTIATKVIDVIGTGKDQKVELADCSFTVAKYYRYQLVCVSGNNNIDYIDRFTFESPSAEKTYPASYLSSPSVHLGSWRSTGAAPANGYDWCYQEIMIPKSSDIVGTYAMALGVLSGYMGIQNNGVQADGTPAHDVLFSMWDDGSTDEDPNLPEYMRAGVVDCDSLTITNRFGNEGTGVQTYRRGDCWIPGRFVQFITNARREQTSYTTIENGKEVEHKQNNILVSAWYNAQDGKGWQYMATVRKRNSTDLFSSWYSFLENYNWATGEASRKAYYRNGFARYAKKGNWYNFNRVDFSHTDGGNAPGARNDYGQGATENKDNRTFFMQTGGYTSTNCTDNEVPLATSAECVDTINYDALNARVLQAIDNEKERVALAELFKTSKYDKSGWKVISFSSQETSGEGSNGLASQIIDGDANTYWHSQWQGTQAKYPHYFVIDMQKIQSIGGFEFTMSGGANRYIKAYDIYVSDDNTTWQKVISDNGAPNQQTFQVRLDSVVNARYIKLVIRDGRATDGCFVRLNELDVVSGNVAVPVQQPSANNVANAQLSAILNNQNLDLILPFEGEKQVAVRLYSTNGICIFNGNFMASKYISIPMPQLVAGAYIVEAVCNEGSSSAMIIKK